MTASDKSAGKWQPAHNRSAEAARPLKKRRTNLSVPRTRKEKCQTERSRCRNSRFRLTSKAPIP
jgi:hypothetical protein